MMDTARITDIAERLARLAPDHRDPHKFHEEKSELVADLRRLASAAKPQIAANDNNATRRAA